MKVISGKYKGRRLEGYTLNGTRPTMDRVKESLFGMIQNFIGDSIVLDLFAGSGALGIESLSQGAKFAYLVDYNSESIKIINQNISTLQITNVEIIKKDYQKALDYFSTKNIKFNIIFLDPPYKTNYITKSLELIAKYSLLMDNGIIVCESDELSKIVCPNNYKAIKNKKYGDKYIVILQKI